MDFEKLAGEFMSGKQGSKIAGKTEDIKKLASSKDGQKVMQMMGDTGKLKNALEKGDTDTLQNVIKNIMSTEEGARLAKQLTDMMK